MTPTEEELKKKKVAQDLSLDRIYKENQQALEKNAQEQYESAYVNQELMNKYLKQNLASQGLDNSGIANLYAQQANTNYMNERAKIAQEQQTKETDLLNAYYADKKAEEDNYQKDLYGLAKSKVDNSLKNGFLNDGTIIELDDYVANSGLNDYYTNLINQYMQGYVPTQEQRDYIAEQEKIAEYSPYYDYENGKFEDEIVKLTGSNGKLSKGNAELLLTKLEDNKDKLGDYYYQELFKSINSLIETEEESTQRTKQETEQAEQAVKEFFKKEYGYYPDDGLVEKGVKGALDRMSKKNEKIQTAIKNWFKRWFVN